MDTVLFPEYTEAIRTICFLFRVICQYFTRCIYRFGGVMVSVLISSAVYRGFELSSGRIKCKECLKTIQLVIAPSPLTSQNERVSSKTG